MDQTDPWQVVPRQVFIPHYYSLISVAFVVLCHVGCLWVTSVRTVSGAAKCEGQSQQDAKIGGLFIA